MGNEINNIMKQLNNQKESDINQIRWYWNDYYQEWDKQIKTNHWNPFPLELCEEIQLAFNNNVPYQYEDKTILFDQRKLKHVQISNSNAWKKHLILREPNLDRLSISRQAFINMFSIKQLNKESYPMTVINHTGIIVYREIFGSYGYNTKDEFSVKFLNFYTILNVKVISVIKGDYKNRLKVLAKEVKDTLFSFDNLKKLLIHCFIKRKHLIKYYLKNMTKESFTTTIIMVFQEDSSLLKDLMEYETSLNEKNINLTVFYLCLLYALNDQQKTKPNNYKAYIINKDDSNNEFNSLKENEYYYTKTMIIGSKTGFNDYIDRNINKTVFEITIEKEQEDYLYLNRSPLYLSKQSLFNDKLVIFPSNTIFYIRNISTHSTLLKNKKTITTTHVSMKVMQTVFSKSLSLMKQEHKEKFKIYEELIIHPDLDLQNYLFAKIKAKQIKYIKKMPNCRAIELYGNDIGNEGMIALSLNFKNLFNLLSLTLIGNDIGFAGFEIFDENLKYLHNLKYLNLNYNFLKDNDMYVLHFSVLKNLHYLHLKGNQITENGMVHLVKEIKACHLLRILDLNENIIKDEGLIALSKEMDNFPHFQSLEVWNCSITEKGFKIFLESISNKKEIESLNIKHNSIGGNEIVDTLLNITKTIPLLKRLNLSQTRFTEEQLNTIVSDFRTRNNQWCYDVNTGILLMNDHINSSHHQNEKERKDPAINHLLTKRHRKTYTKSSLSIDNIYHLNSIISNVSKYNKVKEFNFHDAQIGNNGLILFTSVIPKLSSIEILNLSFNQIGYEGICKLSSLVLTTLINLKFLDLSSNNIGDDGLTKLSERIIHCPLIELILCWNHISDSGLIAYLSTIKGRIQLTTLDLFGNDVTDIGIDHLVQNSTYLKNLSILNLGKNKIGNKGMKSLASSFENFESLTHITISFNKFNDEGVNAFMNHLNHVLHLQHLDISNNYISNSQKELFIALGIPSNFIL